MNIDVAVESREWRAEALGPWERHRRDLDGGRVLIVAPGPDGRWIWDLWADRGSGQCLDTAADGFGTTGEAKADADRAAGESAAAADEQLAGRNGIDMYREPVALRLAPAQDGDRCALCGREITADAAVLPAELGSWLRCGSCASRNPDAIMGEDAVEVGAS